MPEIDEETTETGFVEVQTKSTEYHYEHEKAKIKKEKEAVKIKKPRKKDKKLYRQERRNFVPFLVAFFAIVFVVAIVYLYLESDSIFKGDENKNEITSVERPDFVTVIEREYIYPITYPYNTVDTKKEISGINLGLFSDEEIVFKPPVIILSAVGFGITFIDRLYFFSC